MLLHFILISISSCLLHFVSISSHSYSHVFISFPKQVSISISFAIPIPNSYFILIFIFTSHSFPFNEIHIILQFAFIPILIPLCLTIIPFKPYPYFHTDPIPTNRLFIPIPFGSNFGYIPMPLSIIVTPFHSLSTSICISFHRYYYFTWIPFMHIVLLLTVFMCISHLFSYDILIPNHFILFHIVHFIYIIFPSLFYFTWYCTPSLSSDLIDLYK